MSTAPRRNGVSQPNPTAAAVMITSGPRRSPIDPRKFCAPSIRGRSSPERSTSASSDASTIADAATPIANDAATSRTYESVVANTASAAAKPNAPPAAIARRLT